MYYCDYSLTIDPHILFISMNMFCIRLFVLRLEIKITTVNIKRISIDFNYIQECLFSLNIKENRFNHPCKMN